MRSPLMTVFAAAVLALGVALGGWFVGRLCAPPAPVTGSTAKGVAEREVKADLVLCRCSSRGRTSSPRRSRRSVRTPISMLTFLAANGVPGSAVEVQSLQVNDLLAQPYRTGRIENRVIVAQTLMVRTDEVEKMPQRLRKSATWSPPASFSAGRDSPRPDRSISYQAQRHQAGDDRRRDEERERGRRAVRQGFGQPITGIRRASQGLFQILPRDDAPRMSADNQIAETVRVVSTIDYRLAD